METLTVPQVITELVSNATSLLGKFMEPPLIYVVGLAVVSGVTGLATRVIRGRRRGGRR